MSDWLRRNVRELFVREGYKTIDSPEQTVFYKDGAESVLIKWNHGAK